DGRWIGKGIGKIKENRILINRGVVFPIDGLYEINLEQAMREAELKGIADIGIRIEKM
ncbi:MAG: gliding motility lipoprotein GldH, partial [Bacteroidales bacterium]|nr:gliding motility lipoprotein GldH [Bacteroidales bacterium]